MSPAFAVVLGAALPVWIWAVVELIGIYRDAAKERRAESYRKARGAP